MKRVLFVAELGSGFGHVRRLLPLARAAVRLGHQVMFLVANPAQAGPMLPESMRIGQAPRLAPERDPRGPAQARPAGSFSDVLLRAGFDDPAVLSGALDTWGRVIDRWRPDAAVCELSPFFCLATHGRSLPVLVSGYGFVLPPPELPRFPLLTPAPADWRDPETHMLAVTQAVLRQSGRRDLPALPALFGGTAHAVTGLQVLDPYRALRSAPAVGPPGVAALPAPETPGDDVFAYLLGDAPATLPLLQALARAGVRGRVFVRGATEAHRRAVAPSGLVWLERPEMKEPALGGGHLTVHHGSMLTTEEGLLAGRPQLVMPLYLEHLLTARALLDLEVARVVRPSDGPAAIDRVVAAALADARGGATTRAQAVARDLPRPAPDLPERLLRAVL